MENENKPQQPNTIVRPETDETESSDATTPPKPVVVIHKHPPSWKHALWYLPWFIPLALAFIVSFGFTGTLQGTQSGAGDADTTLAFLVVALPIVIGLFLLGGVCALIGLLFFARFVARKKSVVWALPVIILAIAIVVWECSGWL